MKAHHGELSLVRVFFLDLCLVVMIIRVRLRFLGACSWNMTPLATACHEITATVFWLSPPGHLEAPDRDQTDRGPVTPDWLQDYFNKQ